MGGAKTPSSSQKPSQEDINNKSINLTKDSWNDENKRTHLLEIFLLSQVIFPSDFSIFLMHLRNKDNDSEKRIVCSSFRLFVEANILDFTSTEVVLDERRERCMTTKQRRLRTNAKLRTASRG